MARTLYLGWWELARAGAQVCSALLQEEHLGCRCSSPASQAAGLGHVSFPEPPVWQF